MSSVYKEGYVPEGWTRGDPLRLTSAPRNGRGTISRNPSCVTTIVDEFLLTYWDHEVDDVNKWLKWWRDV